MGKNTEISWCHHSWNPWWGCRKVSAGCVNCYAETLSARFGNDVWGPAKTTGRRLFGAKHWAEPLAWDAAAKKAGERHRVFCASMGDVFEDHPMLDAPRAQLWDLIGRTPNLDWLLLTKRPENIMRMIPQDWAVGGLPANVWAGTSAEDQSTADERIPHLLAVPARVRFLSMEPLLGPVDIASYLVPDECRTCAGFGVVGYAENACSDCGGYGLVRDKGDMIHWVIVGGESGPKARSMHPAWARALRDQCRAAGVAYFFKQWGEWLPMVSADEASWYPNARMIEGDNMRWVAVGKKSAGRLLDGCEHDEFPG